MREVGVGGGVVGGHKVGSQRPGLEAGGVDGGVGEGPERIGGIVDKGGGGDIGVALGDDGVAEGVLGLVEDDEGHERCCRPVASGGRTERSRAGWWIRGVGSRGECG